MQNMSKNKKSELINLECEDFVVSFTETIVCLSGKYKSLCNQNIEF